MKEAFNSKTANMNPYQAERERLKYQFKYGKSNMSQEQLNDAIY